MNNLQLSEKKAGKYCIFLFALFFAQCFLFTATPLEAQIRRNIIALHPFRGPPEFFDMSLTVYEQAMNDIPRVSNFMYAVFPIDLNNLPPDVPEGGFPPWISPSPSITGDSAYAITGEVTEDLDIPDAFRLRLYLWRLEDSRLLGSDEMTIETPEDLGTLPFFLEWVLSWIEEEAPPAGPLTIIAYSGMAQEEHWLYIGLRGGGGYSQLTYDYRNARSALVRDVTSLMSANAALQISVQLIRFFEFQTELNMVANFGPVIDHSTGDSDGRYVTFDLNIPFLAKFVMQSGRLKVGLFGGAYLHLPMIQTGSDAAIAYYDYKADIPGITVGLSAAWRVRRGSLFIDARIDYDGHWFNQDLEKINYRRTTNVNVGYEVGFFRKN